MTTMEEILWAVQLEAYPDSIRLTDNEMREALYTLPETLKGMTVNDWYYKDGYTNEIERQTAFIAYMEKSKLQEQAQWARSAFTCRFSYPDGFFYACSKRNDGTYRYVGFRYGTSVSQYMSGFVGMNYTPEGETT
jgi:hypothetical protein